VEGYKVVVDPGNGATCATLGNALAAFGCRVSAINGEPDGRFPARRPNPELATLEKLAQTVKGNNADFGVGTDSDGDRAIFVSERGVVLWGDLTSAVFAKREIEQHSGGTIITTINTSSIVRIVCQQGGTQLVVTKVGPPAMAEALRSSGDVIFATEESGKHIWPNIILYGDAALASGNLLQIMNEQGKSLAELVDVLPKLYQQKSVIECPDNLKLNVTKLILESWNRDAETHISTLDGLKVEYPDLTWFLVRASGTEPLLRCSAEGKSNDEARVLLERAEALARNAIDKAKETQQK
jgi:phosphomannomutase/phosphoglucomutase